MKLPPTFSTGDPSYFVVASMSRKTSPTVLTVSKCPRVSALSAFVSSKHSIRSQGLRSGTLGVQIRGAGEFAGAVPIRRFEHDAEYETTLGFYQILNQGIGNLTNEPLKPNAPTLSRTDMITIQ
jgi:hypothetical protein